MDEMGTSSRESEQAAQREGGGLKVANSEGACPREDRVQKILTPFGSGVQRKNLICQRHPKKKGGTKLIEGEGTFPTMT